VAGWQRTNDQSLPRWFRARGCPGRQPQHSKSLRNECPARRGPGRQHSNHSAAGVQLEEAQGGAGALGRWDAGAFSDSSAGRCKTRPALWRPPTRVGRGHCPRLCLPHSVGPLPFAGSPHHAELECILHLFGDRNRGGVCESKDQAMGSGGDTGERGA
jgi:hypothetical protein